MPHRTTSRCSGCAEQRCRRGRGSGRAAARPAFAHRPGEPLKEEPRARDASASRDADADRRQPLPGEARRDRGRARGRAAAALPGLRRGDGRAGDARGAGAPPRVGRLRPVLRPPDPREPRPGDRRPARPRRRGLPADARRGRARRARASTAPASTTSRRSSRPGGRSVELGRSCVAPRAPRRPGDAPALERPRRATCSTAADRAAVRGRELPRHRSRAARRGARLPPPRASRAARPPGAGAARALPRHGPDAAPRRSTRRGRCRRSRR